MNPHEAIVKALRDLEEHDRDLLIHVANLLPRIRHSGECIEIRAIRHEGWALSEVNRKRVDVLRS